MFDSPLHCQFIVPPTASRLLFAGPWLARDLIIRHSQDHYAALQLGVLLCFLLIFELFVARAVPRQAGGGGAAAAPRQSSFVRVQLASGATRES